MSQKEPPKTTIPQMDERLAHYYTENSRNDYYNDDNMGKFEEWCNENGYSSDHIEADFYVNNIEDCMCLEFDDGFPLQSELNGNNNNNDNKKMFEILKSLWFNKPQLFIDDFDIDVDENDMLNTYKLYKKYMKTWEKMNEIFDLNILHFLAVSLKQRNNLLMNLVDAYKRDTIHDMLVPPTKDQYKEQNNLDVIQHSKDGEAERMKKWIFKHLFINQLKDKCQHLARNYNLDDIQSKIAASLSSPTSPNSDKNKGKELCLESVIRAYPKRIGRRLMLNGRLINDDLKIIVSYIYASYEFIRLIQSEQLEAPPFLIDFMIVLPPTINDDRFDHNINESDDNDDDDDDDDNKEYDEYIQKGSNVGGVHYDEDIIGDIIKHLQVTQCKYSTIDLNLSEIDPIHLRKKMQETYQEFRSKLKHNDMKHYPQFHRINVIIDRRRKDKNCFIIFEPPNECKNECKPQFHSIPKERHPPEIYFDQSRQCLIPRSDTIRINTAKNDDEHYVKLTTETLDATHAAQGQLMTFSYHVREADDIKCYLLWQGQNHRFYPQDIIEILPKLFKMDKKNKEYVESDDVKRLVMEMEIPDAKFEKFYCGLSGTYDFPKRYKVKPQQFPMEHPNLNI